MERYKFLISGPVGAGKTTAIESAADTEIVHTDVKISDTASLRKDNTTVAMDYGSAVLSNGKKAHLYGTPGQERFDFMWEVLSKGTQGLILLFDNSRNYPQRDLASYLSAFSRLIADVPLVIAVTRMDVKAEPSLAAYREWLSEVNVEAPVMRIDAREKADVHAVMENLAKLIEGATLGDLPDVSTPESSETQATVDEIDTSKEIADSGMGSFQFTDDLMDEVAQLKGVTGVMLNDTMGDLLHSTVDDEQISEFSAIVAGITPMIEESLSLGKIDQVMIKSPKDDNLLFFIEDDKALGVTSQRKSSPPVLAQQVKDVLQWS